MSARIELTAMFAPFFSGTTLEEAVSEAYAVVLNEAADALEARVADVDVDTRTTWAGMDAAYLRHLAAAPAAVPVPDETAGDETAEAYPGELAHLRDLLRDVGRIADKQPEGNPLTELLIDHYSDSRMVDAQLAPHRFEKEHQSESDAKRRLARCKRCRGLRADSVHTVTEVPS